MFFVCLFCFVFLTGSTWAVTFCYFLMKEKSFHQECMIILCNFSFELYYMEIVLVT